MNVKPRIEVAPTPVEQALAAVTARVEAGTVPTTPTPNPAPNPLPEGKYLLKVRQVILLDPDEKGIVHSKILTEVVQPPQFAGRRLNVRLFHSSKAEEAFLNAVGKKKDEDVDLEAFVGTVVWGFTSNKPRRDGPGVFTVVSDYKRVE